jgi:hypothetical protein
VPYWYRNVLYWSHQLPLHYSTEAHLLHRRHLAFSLVMCYIYWASLLAFIALSAFSSLLSSRYVPKRRSTMVKCSE